MITYKNKEISYELILNISGIQSSEIPNKHRRKIQSVHPVIANIHTGFLVNKAR